MAARYLFLDEVESAAEKNPRLKAHVCYSATDGSLTVEEMVENAGGDVQNYDIYMCGPLPMVQAFTRKFKELGVPSAQIHFEEFNFR